MLPVLIIFSRYPEAGRSKTRELVLGPDSGRGARVGAEPLFVRTSPRGGPAGRPAHLGGGEARPCPINGLLL